MSNHPTVLIAPDVKLGKDVKVYSFVNLYGCEIGDEIPLLESCFPVISLSSISIS